MPTTNDHKDFHPSTSILHYKTPTIGAPDAHIVRPEDQEPSASTLRNENGAMGGPNSTLSSSSTESDTEDTESLLQFDTDDTNTLVHSDSDDTDTAPLAPNTTHTTTSNHRGTQGQHYFSSITSFGGSVSMSPTRALQPNQYRQQQRKMYSSKWCNLASPFAPFLSNPILENQDVLFFLPAS